MLTTKSNELISVDQWDTAQQLWEECEKMLCGDWAGRVCSDHDGLCLIMMTVAERNVYTQSITTHSVT